MTPPTTTTICWLDTNGCDQTWHAVTRDDDGMLHVVHADDEDCEEAECMVQQ